MSIVKYLNRIQYMHWLIKNSATGCAEDFACKLGLSKRQLLDNLNELRSIGAPIKFTADRKTYYYEKDWSPFADTLNRDQLNKIKGGATTQSAVSSHWLSLNLFC